jgi:hypothetical protein
LGVWLGILKWYLLLPYRRHYWYLTSGVLLPDEEPIAFCKRQITGMEAAWI